MENNKSKIDRNFCINKALIFYPKTVEEARFIQERIFHMGFSWADGSMNVKFLTQSIDMGILPCLYYCPAWSTDGIGHIRTLESHSLVCNPVHIWCIDNRRTIGTYCLFAMIISENKKDIWLLLHTALSFARAKAHQKKCQCSKRNN